MSGFLNPKDRGRTSLTRPAETNQGGNQRRWFDPTKEPRLYAQDMNRLLAQPRTAADFLGLTLDEGDDHGLRKILEASFDKRLNDVVSFLSYSPAANGQTPEGNKLNVAIAQTAAAGKLLWVPAGKYLMDTKIDLVSGARVWCDDNVEFKRGVTTTGANGLISQASLNEKIVNVRWRGGRLTSIDHTSFTGNMISFHGDHVYVEDVEIAKWAVGRAVRFAGDYCRIRNIKARDPDEQAGGIRMIGGHYSRIMDCDIISNDDCYQFNPAIPPGQLIDLSISNSHFINCVGGSKGRFIIVLLGSVNVEGGMEANIRDVGFHACRGVSEPGGAGGGINVSNLSSSGAIDGVAISDCFIDVQNNGSRNAVDVSNRETFGGPVRRVYFDRVTVNNPPTGVRISGNKVDLVYWNGGRIDPPRTAGVVPFNVSACKGGAVRDATIITNGGSAGIQMGSAAVVGFDIENNRVEGVGNGQRGIFLNGCSGVTVSKNKVIRGEGATSAVGIRLGDPASKNTILGNNDLSEVDVPFDINATVRALGNFIERRNEVEEITANANTDLIVGTHPRYIRDTATLTADRNFTLSTTGVIEGDEFIITRTGGGAFNRNVGAGPLKALATGQWCRVKFHETAWYLVSFGSL